MRSRPASPIHRNAIHRLASLRFFRAACALGPLLVGACQSPDLLSPDRLQPPPTGSRYVVNVPPNGFGVNVNTLRNGEGTYTAAYIARARARVVRFTVYGYTAVPVENGGWQETEVDQTVARILAQGAVPLAVIALIPEWASSGGPYDGTNVPDPAKWRSLVHTIVDALVSQGVEYFEVGNEYNSPGFFAGTAGQYDQLAAIAIEEIHARGKAAVGPATGMADNDPTWTCERVRQAGIRAYPGFDVVSVHRYGTAADIIASVNNVSGCAGGRPVWLTEAGSGGTNDEATSNSILSGVLAGQTWAQTIWWHLFMPTAGAANLLNVDASWNVTSATSLFYTASKEVAVNEYWSQNTHLFTTESVEYRGADRYTGTAGKFNAQRENTGGLTPMVRCVFHGAQKVRRLSLNSCPSGWLLENVPTFWVRTSAAIGWVPLYALTGAAGNMFYTTDAAERASALSGGWSDSGVAAYVHRPVPPIVAPTYAPTSPGRTAVHAGWSMPTHVFYTGSFTGSIPAGFSPDHDTHFVVASNPSPDPYDQPLVQCVQNGRYRVRLSACPAGWGWVSTLGFAYPYSMTLFGSDFVLTEYMGGNGAYFVTADSLEKASLDLPGSGWQRQTPDIARVWF